ncbi:MAG: squalene synthase HpnD [Acidocella sp. 20-57-95]|nr:MAG: squalene synthase HpnD [Acidocella sp. 20-57-95]OYV61833.1 MAG: squalene synthase HpnD [Acidocella sp. 21-58-7]HQT62944.1 presqualene diphosphate synthase HpnD [Acidocella sp.]HQU04083.1 presqualene diphosphate synthase HpnD [Acidocella sp.]
MELIPVLNQADVDAVTAIVRASATSFYHGMKMLPPERRAAMYAIYSFCRLVDDIADEDAPLAAKRKLLHGWRQIIAGVFAGRTSNALTRILRVAVLNYRLREADFVAIIDGMEMDAGAPIVAPPLPILELYCDRVASAVGRLSVRVFGDSSTSAEDTAYALGRALQLTNILRDVREDASRGRLYLPYEYLRQESVPLDPQGAMESSRLPFVCVKLARLAMRYYKEAETSMALCDQKAMKPARIMLASYKPLLLKLHRRSYDYKKGRVSLSPIEKLKLAAQVYLP